MAGNLVYAHLIARAEHAEGCGDETCAPACGHRRFHEWLEEPLLPSEVVDHQRVAARSLELLRGDIPA